MSGFYETDPLQMQEEGWKRQERELREQQRLEEERRANSSSSVGDAYEWKHVIGGCLLSIVIIFVVASIVGWAIATFVVK